MDADLSFDLEAIPRFLENINDYDIAIGSRTVKGSIQTNKPTLIRRMMSSGCHLYTKMLFGFKVKDTQCGIKIYTQKAAKLIAEKQKILII